MSEEDKVSELRSALEDCISMIKSMHPSPTFSPAYKKALKALRRTSPEISKKEK